MGLGKYYPIAKKARDRQGTRTDLNIPPDLTESIDTRKEISELSGVSIGNVSKVEYIHITLRFISKPKTLIGKTILLSSIAFHIGICKASLF